MKRAFQLIQGNWRDILRVVATICLVLITLRLTVGERYTQQVLNKYLKIDDASPEVATKIDTIYSTITNIDARLTDYLRDTQ